MQITLSIDSKHAMEVGHSDLVDFISFLADDPANAKFYFTLVDHPSAKMRAAMSKRDVSVAMQLAYSLESIDRIEVEEVAVDLMSHDDPDVRALIQANQL